MENKQSQIGYRVVGTIISIEGKCSINHQVGAKFDLSLHSAGGLCGAFYHMIFADVVMLQFGGSRPWGDPDIVERVCIDSFNAVRIRLERMK